MARRAFWLSAALSLSLATAAPIARAQSPEEISIARQTAVDGLTAYRAGEYQKAVRLFEQARAIYPSAQILRMHGYTLMALERWEKAAEALQAALASTTSPLNDADRADVQEQLTKATSHFGTAVVTTSLTDAELVVDDGEPKTLPLREPVLLPPGKHKFVVRAPAHSDAIQEAEVVGGKTLELSLDPQSAIKPVSKPAPPPPKPVKPDAPPPQGPWFAAQRPVGFVLAGTGVAVGGAALVTALVAADLRSQVADDAAIHEANYGKGCQKGDPRICAYDIEVTNRDADRADALRDASIWLGIGGGILTAAGVVLVIFAGDSPRKPAVGTSASPRASAPPACGVSFGSTRGISCGGTF